MNKIYLLTAMLLIAAAAMAGVPAPQRGPQKLAHGLPVPVVKPATNVSDAGFTANWEKASGANCYTVYTYIRHKAPADEIYYFYNDDFSGFKYGSIESPFDIGWGWLDGYTTAATGMSMAHIHAMAFLDFTTKSRQSRTECSCRRCTACRTTTASLR